RQRARPGRHAETAGGRLRATATQAAQPVAPLADITRHPAPAPWLNHPPARARGHHRSVHGGYTGATLQPSPDRASTRLLPHRFVARPVALAATVAAGGPGGHFFARPDAHVLHAYPGGGLGHVEPWSLAGPASQWPA